jgi:hypothetical protein
MKNIFTQHPQSVGESYLTHLCHALKFSMEFLLLHIIVLIHAIFPFLFVNTASGWIKGINDRLVARVEYSKQDNKPKE